MASHLGRFLALFVCYYAICHLSYVTVCDGASTGNVISSNLERDLLRKINDFKVRYHRSLEKARMMKGRKSSYELKFGNDGFVEEQLSVKSMEQVGTPSLMAPDLDGVTCWTSVASNEEFYLAWGLRSGSLLLAQFNGPRADVAVRRKFRDTRIGEMVPYKMKHFVSQRYLWLVVAYKPMPEHSHSVQHTLAIYQVNGTIFKQRQIINANDHIDFDILQFKGNTYMAISIGSMYVQRSDNVVKLFMWRNTMFDEVAEKKVPDVRAVALLRIASDIYIATAASPIEVSVEGRIGSPLLLFNVKDSVNPLSIPQNIETRSVSDVHHFNVDGNDYLAFTGRENVVIYWWSGDGFLEYQTLDDTQNTREVNTLKLYDGEVLLGLLAEDRIQFFSASTSWSFVRTHSKQFTPNELGTNHLSSLRLISYANKFIYALLAFDVAGPMVTKHPNPVWKLKLLPIYSADRSKKQWDPLVQCLMDVGSELKKRDDKLRQIAVKADNVWVTNKPQKVLAPVIVKGSLRLDGSVSKIGIIQITSNVTNVPQITNTEISNRLTNVSRQLLSIQYDLNQTVHKNASDLTTITGKITFESPVRAERASVGHISGNVRLNDVSFSDMVGKTLKTTGEQRITGHWTFLNDLFVNKIALNGRLNGKRIDDILLVNSTTPQIVTGNLEFTNVTVGNINMPRSGRINSIPISEFVTTNAGPVQVITGAKILKSAEAKGNFDVTGLTNGYDLSLLAKKAVRLSSPLPQVITGDLDFQDGIDVANLQVNNLINGKVNVTRMASGGVTKDGHNQVISGHKTFISPVTVATDVNVHGKINGLDLAKDVMTTNTAQEITAPMTFQANVKFNSDVDTITVNGIDLSKEVVLKSSPVPQVITARKGFLNTVQVLGNVTMDPGSTIDTVDPSELQHLVLNRNNAIFNDPVVFQDLHIKGNLVANKGVNGFMLRDLEKTLWLKSRDQVINAPVTFLGPVKFDILQAPLLNNMHFPQDFVLKSSSREQVITGEKIFLDEVSLPNGGFTVDRGVKMNGIDLIEFSNSVVRNLGVNGTMRDPINGTKTFHHLVVKGNLYVKTVNGYVPERDFATTNKPQTVQGRLIFAAPETEVRKALLVRGNLNAETVNDLKLGEWMKNVVILGTEQSHTRPIKNKHFAAGLSASTVTADGQIGGVDLRQMKTSVVTLNSMHLITAPKNFTGKIKFEDEVAIGILNDLNMTEFQKRVVLNNAIHTSLRGLTNIKGKVTFNKNVRVFGLINGVNLTELATNAMSKTRGNNITARMTFAGPVSVNNLLIAPNQKLDGRRLEELVYLNRDTYINGTVSFEDNVNINGNLHVKSGVVNGCNLTKLEQDSISLNDPNRRGPVGGQKIFGTVDVDKGLNVSGNVNNVNLPQLAATTATIRGNQTLGGLITFKDTVTVNNLILVHTLNGVNLTHLFLDAVLKNVPQTISGRKVFAHDIVVVDGPLLAGADLRVKGYVNNVNLTLLNETLVTRHGAQRIYGRKIFTSPDGVNFKKNVSVEGMIGSEQDRVRVPHDVVLKKTMNDLIGGKIVFDEPTHFKRDLNVAGTINGIDLDNFLRSRYTLSGDQTTSGNFAFRNEVRIDKLIVRGTINGIPVREIVTRGGNHVLNGSYEFLQDIFVNGNLSLGPQSTINGISPRELAREAVDIRRENILPGTTVLRGDVHIGDKGIIVRSLSGIDPVKLDADFKAHSAQINKVMSQFRSQVNAQEIKLSRQLRALEDQVTSLSYFDNWYEFSTDDLGRSITIERFLSLPVLLFNESYYNRMLFQPTVDSLLYWRITKSNYENPPCREYATVHLNVEANGNLEETGVIAKRSRAFPIFPNPLHDSPTTAFYLWTNTSSCGEQRVHETSNIVTMFAKRQELMRARPQFELYSPPKNSPYLKDAKFFSDHSELFIVLAYSYYKPGNTSKTYSLVYRHDESQQNWMIQQRIETYGAISLDVINFQRSPGSEREILLAIANRLTVRGTPAPSLVMRWNHEKKNFVTINTIHTWSPSSVLFVSTLNAQSEPTLMLVFANEKAKLFGGRCDTEEDAVFSTVSDSYSSFFTQPINVYSYGGAIDGFEHVQSINIPGVNTIDTFSLPPSETFLVVGSKLLGRTFILKHRGYNMFQEIQSFPTPGVENAKVYWSKSGDLFLAVASSKPGYSKILKAVINGPSPKLRFIKSPQYLSKRTGEMTNSTSTLAPLL